MKQLKMLLLTGMVMLFTAHGGESSANDSTSSVNLQVGERSAKVVAPNAKITGLYVAYFNRAADQKGLSYWTDKAVEVAQAGGDVSSVFNTLSAGFATHPTYKSTYDHLNNEEFVSLIYRNALGRDGDAEGIAFWTDLLDRDVMSRSDMVANFIELSMTTELTPENYPNLSDEELAAAQLRQDLITNKVTVGLAFTNQLGDLSNVVDSQNPEQDPAYLASIKIISEVTEDPATVSDTLEFLGSIEGSDDPIGDILEEALADGIYLYKKDTFSSTYTEVTLPSICDGITCVKRVSGTYAGTTTVTHGEYKLLAVGQDFTITNLIATDLNHITWVKINGLSEGQTIQAGNMIEFTTTSGLTGYQESKLQWSFNINGTLSFMDTVYFTSNGTANQVPVADAGLDQSVDSGDTVILDGSGSSDFDDDPLTYSWSIENKPTNSNAQLYDPSAEKPEFIADIAGVYTLKLVVNDGIIDSNPDEVLINTTNVIHVSNTIEFRQALLDAAQNGFDDKIVLADGVYKTTDDGGGTFKFLDSEDYEVFIVGLNKDNVILSGSNQNQIFSHVSTSWNSRVTFDSITFKEGNATIGAGVYIDKKGTILNCIFTDNNAISRGGGFYSADRVIVNNSTFTRNNATSAGGGFYSVGTADVADCNFTYNTASSGGGFATGRNDTAYISNSIFENNSAGAGSGGGFSSYWTARVKNSIFKNNSAGTAGGGFISTNAGAEIENSIFTDNNSTRAGAFSVSRYELKVMNSLLINNTTGISATTNTLIINSIFNNIGIEISGGVVDLNNNYIDESKVTSSILGTGNIFDNINLGFVDESNDDYHLTASSDLIDAGIDSYTGVTIPTTDLDGNPRPVGASTDIGPYEDQ